MDIVYVLMATYNGDKYITEQINSILSQTYENWVLLVRDDISSDRTLDILKKFESKDDRIKIIKATKRFGIRENFNCLIECALNENAQYIMFADQDDVWLNDKIEVSLREMKKAESDDGLPVMVYGNYEFVDENLQHLSYANRENGFCGLNRNNTLFIQNSILGATMMINRKLGECVVKIPDVVDYHDRWISLLATTCGSVVYLNSVVEKHRIHDNNATQNVRTDSLKSKLARLKIFIRDHDAYWRNLTELYEQLLLRIEEHDLLPNKTLLSKYEVLLNKRGFTGVIFIIKNKFFMIKKKQTLWLLVAMLIKRYKRYNDI